VQRERIPNIRQIHKKLSRAAKDDLTQEGTARK